MPLSQQKIYTEEDYYALPENVRAELIDGQLIYNQAAGQRDSAVSSPLYVMAVQKCTLLLTSCCGRRNSFTSYISFTLKQPLIFSSHMRSTAIAVNRETAV